MADSLIGYSGFVGSTLLRQTAFDDLYRSTNISNIDGRSFETVVCAGAPAQKWRANADPEADRAQIEGLIGHLESITCVRMILISTVDVFAVPDHVDETTTVDETQLEPYGLHRRMLERFVQDSFDEHLVVRLPGLVGPGLRKNVVFDLLNDNNLDAVESRNIFQFYPMVNLWHDISIARHATLSLVHLTAAPVSVAEVALEGTGEPFLNALGGSPVSYDMQTRHADLFGGVGRYQYSARETFQAVRSYMQSEAKTLPGDQGQAKT